MQRPLDRRIATVVSLYDTIDVTLVPFHVAQFFPTDVSHEDVLSALGILVECTMRELRDCCSVWMNNHELIPEGDTFEGRNGMHFYGLIARQEILQTVKSPKPRRQGKTKATNLIQTNMQRQRKILSLADQVPAPSWTYLKCDRLQFLHHHLSQRILPEPCFEFSAIEWHPAAAEALHTHEQWQMEIPICLWFFTDGSTNQSKTVATAAVTLVVETHDRNLLGGYHVFEVHGQQTAQRAENVAVLGAVMWAIQILNQCTPSNMPKVAFCFDSTTAGYAGAGSWNSHSHTDVTALTRSLVHWIEERSGTACNWHHVYSHCGSAWNEMADCIAWHAAHHDVSTVELKTLSNICTFDGEHEKVHEWLWYYERAVQGHPSAPQIDHKHMKFNVAAPLNSQPDSTLHPIHMRTKPCGENARVTDTCALKVATANVLTL